MPLTYSLVQRNDMHKGAAEGAKLYYAQVRSQQKLTFEKLCDMISKRSTAFTGDVMLVIEGLLSVMEERLTEGDIIRLGRLGSFRAVMGSKGVKATADFNAGLFNKPRIIFSPGIMLSNLKDEVKVEKAVVKECDRPHTV